MSTIPPAPASSCLVCSTGHFSTEQYGVESSLETRELSSRILGKLPACQWTLASFKWNKKFVTTTLQNINGYCISGRYSPRQSSSQEIPFYVALGP